MMDVETIFDSDREEYEFMQDKKEKPMKEQIEEMVELICDNFVNGKCATDGFVCNRDCEYKDRAEKLYNAGYRKQKEGEWKILIYNKHCSCGKSQKVARYECSVCKRIADMQPYGLSFCPNCGAHMRGGENE